MKLCAFLGSVWREKLHSSIHQYHSVFGCVPWRTEGRRDYFDSDLIDTADDEPSRAASQREGTVPAPATGSKLQGLFVRPRRTVRAKRSQPGASLLKPAPAPPVGNMDVSALRELVCRLCKEVEALKAELRDCSCRVGVFPAYKWLAHLQPLLHSRSCTGSFRTSRGKFSGSWSSSWTT